MSAESELTSGQKAARTLKANLAKKAEGMTEKERDEFYQAERRKHIAAGKKAAETKRANSVKKN
ncbi:hypothetical protein R80B4_00480 [Fibrobacteres bacterium R8-0-B4]